MTTEQIKYLAAVFATGDDNRIEHAIRMVARQIEQSRPATDES